MEENKSVVEEVALSPPEQELFHQMMEAGVFYGRSKSKTNPLMRPYILTTRSGFEVIDLQKTISNLELAAKALKETLATSGLILFVGTNPAAKTAVKKTAQDLKMPWVVERWLGGTITNFKVILGRVNSFKQFKEDKAAGKLEKYPKKERLKMGKDLMRLEKFFGGLENLDRMPSLIFIADLTEDKLAAKEVRRKEIPAIAIVNTDADPSLVDYPIPANSRNRESVGLILDYLVSK